MVKNGKVMESRVKVVEFIRKIRVETLWIRFRSVTNIFTKQNLLPKIMLLTYKLLLSIRISSNGKRFCNRLN